jgi:hypothetical protein
VKIHQLSPTSFLEVSKFIWVLKTFGCNPSVDAFARFYELVIILRSSRAMTGNFITVSVRVALSTRDVRIPEKELPESRLLLVACLTSPMIGGLIGFI